MNPPTCLKSFKNWLSQKKYSSSTIRNYLADLNKYYAFNPNLDHFSSSTLNLYLNSISTDQNQSRYISSLTKFFHFALDQKIIQVNPFKKDENISSNELLNLYQNYLNQNHFSPATVKNYLADIQQFIDWSKNNL